jgi:sugar lactone lactonase YvrE
MLFRKYIVSTRTFFSLAVILMAFVGRVGVAQTANLTPVLVPLTMSTLTGDTQAAATHNGSTIGTGYTGEGGQAAWTIANPAISTLGIDSTATGWAANWSVLPPVITGTASPVSELSANNRTDGAMLNIPSSVAIDSAGNVYIADTGNAIIREINAQTGNITTVAGKPPSNCSSTGAGCVFNSGCSDGVPAYLSPIGNSITSIALDAYGNLYFDDNSTASISVVYRGGTQVANFITLEDPGGVAVSGGSVQVGYVYHVGGTVALGSCAATKTPAVDNAMAFQGAVLDSPGRIGLDSAGNIYVQDTKENVVRVINTQATTQMFFQFAVQPGFMKSIVDCGATTTLCLANLTDTANTGMGGPAGQASYSNSLQGMSVDAYGNVYQVNGQNALPFQFVGVAYAGGAPLANLITLASAGLPPSTATPGGGGGGPLPGTSLGLQAAYGDFYDVCDNAATGSGGAGNAGGYCGTLGGNSVVWRPTNITVDALGNIWYWDNHYPSMIRIDAVSQWARLVNNTNSGHSSFGSSASVISYSNVSHCIYGKSGTAYASGQGPVVNDPFGDGCYLGDGVLGTGFTTAGMSSDGPGNLYMADGTTMLIREIAVDTSFPPTLLANPATVAVTTPPIPGLTATQGTTQTIQIHFYAKNLPVISVANSNTADFSIAPGSPDFKIDYLDPIVKIGNNTPTAQSAGNVFTGTPYCTAIDGDGSRDCAVPVTFNPLMPGVRRGALVVNTIDTATVPTTYPTYTFPLSGIGVGAQLAIDGGLATPVPTTATLGGTINNKPQGPAGIAVSPTGTIYIADPANDRILVEPAATFNSATTLGSVNLTGNYLDGSNGSHSSSVSGTMGLAPGWTVSDAVGGTIIPSGTTIVAVGSLVSGASAPLGTVVLSAPALASTVIAPGTANPSGMISITAKGPEQTIGGIGVQLAGNGLNHPMGVALDAADNLYISDTGNNRIIEIQQPLAQLSQTNPSIVATTLGNYSWVPGPGYTAPPQYAFNQPEGLAVDSIGNVYVADTGNKVVVEIPSNPVLGGATPLLQYAGAPQFVTPVAVAVDAQNNIYVADQNDPASMIIVIPAGGGDLVTLPGSHFTRFGANEPTQPNGVVVDAAGDVYVSDGIGNAVWVAPATKGIYGNPYMLNFPGIKAPSGLALDASGNLYISDSGNDQVLFDNRMNPTASFGDVPQYLASPSGLAGVTWTGSAVSTPCPVSEVGNPCTGVLTMTNIGNESVTLNTPLLTVASVSPVGDTAFSITNSGGTLADNCTNSPMPAGTNCTISPTFAPTSDGAQSETINVNDSQSVTLVATTGVGEPALANIALSDTFSSGASPAGGATANITATVQRGTATPSTYAGTPTGTVTFTWAVNVVNPNSSSSSTPCTPPNCIAAPAPIPANYASCGTNNTTGVTVPLTVSGSTATATIPAASFPVLAQGRTYTIYATYNGDPNYGATLAPALPVKVPGITVQASAPSQSFTYGGTVPAITGGVVTGVTDSSVVSTFTSGAGSLTDAAKYPISVYFSGGTFCNYGMPPVTTTPGGSTQAYIVENQAPLSVVVAPYSTMYGAAAFDFSTQTVITGAVNQADLSSLLAGESFSDVAATPSNPTPPGLDSSVLLASSTPYPVIPTIISKVIGNYIVTTTDGSDTVVPAPTAIGISQGTPSTAVLPTTTAINGAAYSINVATTVTAGKGIPSGTVTVSDTFIPIIATAPGTGPEIPACSLSFTGSTTSGSSTITGVPNNMIALALGVLGVQQGDTVTDNVGGTVIPSGTTITAITGSGVILSASATASATNAMLTATFPSTPSNPCNPVLPTVTQSTGLPQLALGYTSFTPSSSPIVVGTHYYNLTYSGDSNFNSSTSAQATTLLINNPDYTLSSSTPVLAVAPGVAPSGDGLPSVPNQSVAFPETSAITISGVLGFVGQVALTCTTPASYVHCQMSPPLVTLAASGANAVQTSILSVWTPATLPLGYNTAQIQATSTRTVLAFLPLGILAFCVRRRRRLSKALWMLLAIVAVSVGVSGCAGNQVDFYTPVPAGPQIVTVTATFGGSTSPAIAAVARSLPIQISIN